MRNVYLVIKASVRINEVSLSNKNASYSLIIRPADIGQTFFKTRRKGKDSHQ